MGKVVLLKDAGFTFITKDSTVVLFLVDLEAPMTLAGNFSGVKRF